VTTYIYQIRDVPKCRSENERVDNKIGSKIYQIRDVPKCRSENERVDNKIGSKMNRHAVFLQCRLFI
jgi:hypothetical protein